MNVKYVLLALFGATAGQGVVWYTGQFYALTFLQSVLKVSWIASYLIVSVALVLDDAAVPLLRRPVRSYRTKEDHDRGLPPRRGHLHSDLHGHEGIREPARTGDGQSGGDERGQ